MKKNAFTLIELLAVIIIIAIIATITTSKITNAIDNSKEKIAKNSALSYTKVIDEYIMHEKIKKNNITLNGNYNINENGYLYNNNETHEIKFNGEKPNGFLVYNNNELQSGCIAINEYKITFENGEISNTEKGICENQ